MNKKIFLVLGTILLFLGSTSLWGARQGPELWHVTRDIEIGESNLKDEHSCWLCGKNDRSLIDYYRKTNDLGVIDFNTLSVYPIEMSSDNSHTSLRVNVLGKNQCVFNITNSRRVTEIRVTFDQSNLDTENLKNNFCKKCIDQVTEVFTVSGEITELQEPVDICLIDFKTGELYSLQKMYLSYYLNNYYVLLQHSEEGIKIVTVDISEGESFDEK